MRSIFVLVGAALFIAPLSLSALGGCGDGGGGSGGGGGNAGGGDGSCSKTDPCPQGGTCVFGAGSCQEGARGTCVSIIQCDGPSTGPVCGCDGKTIESDYGNCNAETYDSPAGCQVGTFACGPTLQCKRNSEVCVATVSGTPGSSSFACQAFAQVTMPGWCLNGIPYCDCIDLSSFGDGSATCAADADHQETITVTMP